MEWTWAQYLPDPITALDERASPTRHRRNPFTMESLPEDRTAHNYFTEDFGPIFPLFVGPLEMLRRYMLMISFNFFTQ